MNFDNIELIFHEILNDYYSNKYGGDMPFFTVIVPIYNSIEYLDSCLKSIESQTFRDFDVILVDNASSDGSSSIIDEYCNRTPSVFRTIKIEINEGPAKARNLGILNTNSDYLVFVDSDDFLQNDYLSRYFDLLFSNPQTDVVYSSLTLVKNSKLNRKISLLNNNWSKFKFQGPWAKCIRTDFLKSNQIYFLETTRFGEDIFFTFKLGMIVTNWLILNDNTYNLVLHSNSTTQKNKSSNLVLDPELLLTSIFTDNEILFDEYVYSGYFFAKIFTWYIYTYLNRIFDKDVNVVIRKMIRIFSLNIDKVKFPLRSIVQVKGENFVFKLISFVCIYIFKFYYKLFGERNYNVQ